MVAKGVAVHRGHFKKLAPLPPPKQRVRFTPAMVERLRTMAAQGHPATSILKALQLLAPLMPLTPDSIRRKATCIGVRLKYARHKGCCIDFETTADVVEAMRAIAYSRGLSVRQFARLIIQTVIRDDLTNAILEPPTRAPIPPGTILGRPRKTSPVPAVAPAPDDAQVVGA